MQVSGLCRTSLLSSDTSVISIKFHQLNRSQLKRWDDDSSAEDYCEVVMVEVEGGGRGVVAAAEHSTCHDALSFSRKFDEDLANLKRSSRISVQ